MTYQQGQPYMARERGSRDWRMLAASITAWLCSSAAHFVFHAGNPWVTGVAFILAAALLAAAAVFARATRHGGIRHGYLPYGRSMAVTLMVAVCAGVIACIAAIAADIRMSHDAVATLVRHGSLSVAIEAYVMTPATRSAMRQADCQADVRIAAISSASISRTSSSKARLFAQRASCRKLIQGAEIRISGMIRTSPYDDRQLWLVSEGADSAQVIRPPNHLQQARDAMQRSFFAVTEHLSEQGRVLVPGLTIGVLGQDFLGSGERDPVNATYATLLETRFKQSGIMHLMAVSGGHFVLLGSCIRRLCAWLLLPLKVVAIGVAGGYLLLAYAMFPADSVSRALIMGLLATAAVFLGRRPQTLSALCWTILAVLVLDPAKSLSFGFALSCAAVLGIVTCSGRIARLFAAWMPRILADAVAVSVAAQIFTLPIQILMQPELPLLSIPANLIVWPFVDFSTLTGLAAFACAAVSQDIAFALAWLSSGGTAVMEWCANWLGGQPMAVVPWAGGFAGVLLAAVVEGAVMAVIWLALRYRFRANTDEGLPGITYHATAGVKLAQWWRDTYALLKGDG